MALAGKGGSVKIGTNVVAEIKSWSLDIGADNLDKTALGDNWKSFLQGLKEWSATAEGNWVISTDTNGQKAIQDAYLAGNTVTLNLYVNATNYYSGTALISSISVETGVEDLVTVSFEFQGVGALTFA